MDLPKRKPTKTDALVFAVLLVLLVLLVFRSNAAPDAAFFTVETPDGSETFSLAASGTLAYDLDGMHIEIRYENGGVWVEKSGCPDGICVNTGTISRAGESIVCVPARLVISIPNGRDTENHEDFIIG
ncbi:MAG: NusG domain II-containing protein [Clostridia bacterium]|nr:NusG domain II-containing protein [Clostridia bacterium]